MKTTKNEVHAEVLSALKFKILKLASLIDEEACRDKDTTQLEKDIKKCRATLKLLT